MNKPKFEVGQEVRLKLTGKISAISCVSLPTVYRTPIGFAMLDPDGIPKYRLVGEQCFHQENELELTTRE